VEGQDSFCSDDALGTQDGPQRGLQIMRIGCHHAAPEISTSGDFVDLQHLWNQPQGADNAIEFAVGHFNGDESYDVVPHLFEVHFAACCLKDPGPEQPFEAALRSIAGDAEGIAELGDLDAGVLDEFQQDLQVHRVQGIQMVTPAYFDETTLSILLNFPTFLLR